MDSRTQRKKNWGGKRPGAGRPGQGGRVTVCARIGIELAKRLKQAAKEQDTTLSNVIEMLLSTAVEREGKTLRREHIVESCRKHGIKHVDEQGGQEFSSHHGPHHFAKKDHKPRIEPLELLAHLLEQNGLSPKDLAQILGLDVVNAARILEGTGSITPQHAVRLGEQFKLRPALFLSLEYRTPSPLVARRSNLERKGPQSLSC